MLFCAFGERCLLLVASTALWLDSESTKEDVGSGAGLADAARGVKPRSLSLAHPRVSSTDAGQRVRRTIRTPCICASLRSAFAAGTRASTAVAPARIRCLSNTAQHIASSLHCPLASWLSEIYAGGALAPRLGKRTNRAPRRSQSSVYELRAPARLRQSKDDAQNARRTP
uniref:Secreted protein n=1 Tax=Mycena chlorophos TaxID=658473 RepID=A0ABQ0LVB9_MYCCL|nr:predicted protein [Mycena chlorophos]